MRRPGPGGLGQHRSVNCHALWRTSARDLKGYSAVGSGPSTPLIQVNDARYGAARLSMFPPGIEHPTTKGRDEMSAKKYAAEAIGTFWLTFAGCGSAVIASAFPQVGIGLVGVSLAFGLSVVTMAYAIGHVSGCHLNPAVTVGLAVGGRFPTGQIAPYVIAQVIGAISAAALLYVIASGAAGFDVSKGFASNGYDAHSPGKYSLLTCFLMEVAMTAMFLFIIMGSTHGKAPAGFAPLAIGLALVMIHLVSIPVTNTSVNPARSTGPALFVGGWALAQLWLFWVAPLIGGALGGMVYRWLSEEPAGVVEGTKPA